MLEHRALGAPDLPSRRIRHAAAERPAGQPLGQLRPAHARTGTPSRDEATRSR